MEKGRAERWGVRCDRWGLAVWCPWVYLYPPRMSLLVGRWCVDAVVLRSGGVEVEVLDLGPGRSPRGPGVVWRWQAVAGDSVAGRGVMLADYPQPQVNQGFHPREVCLPR